MDDNRKIYELEVEDKFNGLYSGEDILEVTRKFLKINPLLIFDVNQTNNVVFFYKEVKKFGINKVVATITEVTIDRYLMPKV